VKQLKNVMAVHNAGTVPEKKITVIFLDPLEVHQLVRLALDASKSEHASITAKLLATLPNES